MIVFIGHQVEHPLELYARAAPPEWPETDVLELGSFCIFQSLL